MTQSGSLFGDLGFWATDSMTSGPPPPGGQGFSMSSDEMRALLTKAKTMRDVIRQHRNDATKLIQVTPPADEPASNNAVFAENGIIKTGDKYMEHMQNQEDYFSELIQRMERALGITEAADQQASETAKKSGSLG